MTRPSEDDERDRILDLVDANLVAFGRYLAAATPGDGANPGQSVADAAIKSGGALNTGGAIDPAAVLSAAVLPVAAMFFATRGHGPGIWTRAHSDAELEAVLPAAGFVPLVDLPVMVLTESPAAPARPTELDLRRVIDAAGAGDFLAIERYALADDQDDRSSVGPVFADPASLLAPEVAAFVAYVDGSPAAAAMSFTDGEVTRVGWVGTIPSFRRRGLGDAVTRAALLAGFGMGARIAVLESSPMGSSMYRAIGFREITRYRVWIRPT